MKKLILLIVILAGCRENTPYVAIPTSSPSRLVRTEKLVGGQFEPDIYVFRDNKTEKEYLVVQYREAVAVTPMIQNESR